jgi:hypothetical protein
MSFVFSRNKEKAPPPAIPLAPDDPVFLQFKKEVWTSVTAWQTRHANELQQLEKRIEATFKLPSVLIDGKGEMSYAGALAYLRELIRELAIHPVDLEVEPKFYKMVETAYRGVRYQEDHFRRRIDLLMFRVRKLEGNPHPRKQRNTR